MLKENAVATPTATPMTAESVQTAEQRFAKALISVSALMVTADSNTTPQAMVALGQLLVGNQHVRKHFEVEDACALYVEEVNGLKQSRQVEAVIERIADSVEDRLWRDEVLETAELVGMSNINICMGAAERAMLGKLQTALA